MPQHRQITQVQVCVQTRTHSHGSVCRAPRALSRWGWSAPRELSGLFQAHVPGVCHRTRHTHIPTLSRVPPQVGSGRPVPRPGSAGWQRDWVLRVGGGRRALEVNLRVRLLLAFSAPTVGPLSIPAPASSQPLRPSAT